MLHNIHNNDHIIHQIYIFFKFSVHMLKIDLIYNKIN